MYHLKKKSKGKQPIPHDHPIDLFWKILISILALFIIGCFIILIILTISLINSGLEFQEKIKDFANVFISSGLGVQNQINNIWKILNNVPIEKKQFPVNNLDWSMMGKDLKNNKFNDFVLIDKNNINDLTPYCFYELNSSSISSPVIIDSLVYLVYSREIICFHLYTCQTIWKKSIYEILSYPDDILITTSSTPSLFLSPKGIEGLIFGIVGDRKSIINISTGEIDLKFLNIPCQTVGLNRFTGELLFITEVGSGKDRDNFCEQTMSYTIFENLAISGLSSSNNYFYSGNNFSDFNLTFQGSVHAIDIETGELLWKTYVLDGPLNGLQGGYSGGGFIGFGTSPILENERMIFFANGQLFNYTQDVSDCLVNNIEIKKDYTNGYFNCLDESLKRNEIVNHNSVIAFDIDFGKILWSSIKIGQRNGLGINAWSHGCNGYLPQPNNQNGSLLKWCSVRVPGANFQYTQSPLLHLIDNQWRLIIESKGSFIYSFDAISGNRIWGRNLGKGSNSLFLGGSSSYNPIYDIFYSITGFPSKNINGEDENLSIPVNGRIICNSSIIRAIDARYGSIIWETFLPSVKFDNDCPYPNNDTEIFKLGLNLTTIDNNYPSFVSSCLGSETEFNIVSGTLSITSHYGSNLLFMPTLTGVFIMDAENGYCLNYLECPLKIPGNINIIIKDFLLSSCNYNNSVIKINKIE